MSLRLTITVSLCPFLVACGGPGARASSGLSATDSSGVVIVTNPGIDRPLPWSFAEVARIGGEDEGPGAFTRATANTVGTDEADRIHVLDYDAMQLHTFTADGNSIASVGGKGGGPGEFLFPSGIGVGADGRRAVYDFAKEALIQWAPDGTQLGELRLPRDGSRSPAGSLRLMDGAVLIHTQTVDSLHEHHHLTSFGLSDTVDIASMSRPLPKMQQFTCVGMMLSPLFSPSLQFGVGGGNIAVVREAAYIVELFTPDGRRSIRRTIAPAVPVPADAKRLYPSGMTVRFGGGSAEGKCTTPAEEVAEKAGLAASIPLIKAVAVGRDGTLWVQRNTFEGETPATDVFDPEGEYLGTLVGRSVPLGFLSNDRVLFGVTDDETGVTRIGVFRVTRTEESNRP